MNTKRYRIWKQGRFMKSRVPGCFVIAGLQGVFGRLDCPLHNDAKDKIFVHTYKDAIAYGARPCEKCNPKPENAYYQCGTCSEFIAIDVPNITTCSCARLTIDPMGCGLIQISGRPGEHRRIGPKKKQTPA
ncbi:MAG: Ada metal-binding domain-containing protein [Candidatus Paceibacterota bacterium]|jgi:hypothetical protein